MKYIINTITYHYDINKPQIEISWGIIHEDETNTAVWNPFITELFKWHNFPEILSHDVLRKMKPLRDEEEDMDQNTFDDSLFIFPLLYATNASQLKGDMLEFTPMNTPAGYKWAVRLKFPKLNYEWDKSEIKKLYPISYVTYSDPLSECETSGYVSLHRVIQEDVVIPKPDDVKLYKFNHPPKLHNLFNTRTSSNSNREKQAESSITAPNDPINTKSDTLVLGYFSLFQKESPINDKEISAYAPRLGDFSFLDEI